MPRPDTHLLIVDPQNDFFDLPTDYCPTDPHGGVFAPAKTPPHIVQQLAAAVTAAVRDPAVSAKLGEMGYEPGGVPTAEFASQVKSDHALWTGLIRRAGARLD